MLAWNLDHYHNLKMKDVKNIADNVLLTNYNVIAIFLISDQFGATQKPNSGYMVHIF